MNKSFEAHNTMILYLSIGINAYLF